MKSGSHISRASARITVTALSLLCSAGILAAEPATSQNGVRFSATPFLWLAGMDGEVTVRGRSADFDVSFGDILENLDMSFMGRFQMETGNWVIQAEPIYMKLSDSVRGPAGFIDADGDMEAFIGKFTAGYAFQFEESRLIAFAGIRYWSLEVGLELTAPGATVDVEKSDDFVDPIVGGRFDSTLSGKWRIHLEADIGGFGTGTEFTWDFTGLLGYDFSPTKTVFAGYRIMDVDYEKKGPLGANNQLDLQMDGPIIGAQFRF